MSELQASREPRHGSDNDSACDPLPLSGLPGHLPPSSRSPRLAPDMPALSVKGGSGFQARGRLAPRSAVLPDSPSRLPRHPPPPPTRAGHTGTVGSRRLGTLGPARKFAPAPRSGTAGPPSSIAIPFVTRTPDQPALALWGRSFGNPSPTPRQTPLPRIPARWRRVPVLVGDGVQALDDVAHAPNATTARASVSTGAPAPCSKSAVSSLSGRRHTSSRPMETTPGGGPSPRTHCKCHGILKSTLFGPCRSKTEPQSPFPSLCAPAPFPF